MARHNWLARGLAADFATTPRSPYLSLIVLILASSLLAASTSMARPGLVPARPAPDYPTRWLEGDLQIDPELLTALGAHGTADFFVRLRLQADLDAAARIDDWQAQGWYVYDALRAAAGAQAPILAYAGAHGLEARTLLGDNSVFLRGGTLADVRALAARPDVYHIRANRRIPLEPADTALQPAPQGAGWNLDTLDPAAGLYGMQAVQVWQEYGIRGEGIVVGSIDTGVYYQHPALDRQYRGNLSGAIGGPYDHNYSWYQPTVAGCGDGTYPCDWDDHGSGSIGLLVGETPDLVEQIGVAPGARWIACMGCTSTACSELDLKACMDWMLAPTDLDGNNPDPGKRPHVVSNAWGGAGCDDTFHPWLDNWYSAGIFPAFSSGGASACFAIGSPGDAQHAFTPSAHHTSGTNLYAGGPSCYFCDPSCDPDAHQVKPNLNAPTFGRTADKDGGYYNLGGSSGAVAHAAGAAILVLSANPAYLWDVPGTFTILEQSAQEDVPPGVCGEPACAVDHVPNYEYGWGYLDAYAAVTMAGVGGLGWLEGTVTGTGRCDAGSYPLQAGVLVENSAGLTWTLTSDATGHYHASLLSDTYTLTFDAVDHLSATTAAQVQQGVTTTLDAALRALLPCLAVVPDAFRPTLPVDVVYTDVLTIANAGAGELAWQLEEALPVRAVDVPWVTEVPTAGVVLADSTSRVDVVFDSGGLVAGTCYTAALELEHDDGGLPGPQTIPLEMCLPAAHPLLTLTKEVQPGLAYPGDVVTFAIAAANGGDPLAGAVLTDTLPGGVAYAGSAPPGDYDPAGHCVTWDGITLGAGERVTFSLEATAGVGITPGCWLTNVALLHWDEAAMTDTLTATAAFYLDFAPSAPHYSYLPLVVKGE